MTAETGAHIDEVDGNTKLRKQTKTCFVVTREVDSNASKEDASGLASSQTRDAQSGQGVSHGYRYGGGDATDVRLEGTHV
jgi:hypothetical protein